MRPNKSIWRSSSALFVETWFLALSELLTYFIYWQASHIISFLHSRWGSPYFLYIYIVYKLISCWYVSSSSKQFTSLLILFISITWMFSSLFQIRIILLSTIQITKQYKDSNITISYNWLILSKLYFKPSINKTCS